MFGIGPQEWIVIILVIVLLFGARKIPEIMRGLGTGIREFKEASSKAMSEIEQATTVETKPQPQPTPPPAVAPTAATPDEAPKVEPH
jgi:sec-independent protein translocase protein TatA